MSTPVKRKAGSPLSDVEPEAKPKAPGPSSPSPKEKSLPSSPEATAADQTAPGMLSGAHWLQQHQQAETDDELDSSLGSDAESSTASIASTIYNYRVLHGRTYHSEAVTDNEYWGPNDQKQIEALDIYYHGIWLMLGEKLHQAPIKDDIKHAIDIGTGSGLWAVDFADKYPNCEVIGTDISPIQPSWCPPNLNFQIDDATKPWTFKKNHFDYVHIMFMNGSIADWDAIYQEAYRCCKPGGWIEHVDVSSIMRSDDDSIIPGSAIDQYGKILVEAGKRFGRSASVSEDGKQEEGIKAAGFVNMEVKEFKMPMSGWPEDPMQKQIGLCGYAAVVSDIEGAIQFHFGQIMGWSTEEIAAFSSLLRKEFKESKQHAYWPWKSVYAQKPLDAE